MDNVRSKCIDVFAKTMEVSSDQVSDETDPGNLEQWDSLTHVQLISALEKEFNIEIAPDEGIDLENFLMIHQFVEKKVA
ncbi:acyl carrier protein [Thermodesulfobacteriota bacterium]